MESKEALKFEIALEQDGPFGVILDHVGNKALYVVTTPQGPRVIITRAGELFASSRDSASIHGVLGVLRKVLLVAPLFSSEAGVGVFTLVALEEALRHRFTDRNYLPVKSAVRATSLLSSAIKQVQQGLPLKQAEQLSDDSLVVYETAAEGDACDDRR